MKAPRSLLLLLAATPLLATTPARAEYPHPAFYLGVYGGYNLKLRDWDLGGNATQPNPNGATTAEKNGFQPNSGGLVGIRVGAQILSFLAVEGEVAYMSISDNRDAYNHALTYNLDVLVHFLPKHNWTPFVVAGVGAYTLLSGELGHDTDPRGHLGLGLRGLIANQVALRLEVRDVISDGYGDFKTTSSFNWGANNIEFLFGLDFFAVRGKGPSDKDKDGVVDTEDACPDVAGPAANKGCPDKDSDGDGVLDKDDACPNDAGVAALGGCPDKDGDGVADAKDQCPDVPAGKVADEAKPGCPADKDGDGVIDENDACVDVAAGKYPDAAQKGCPADRDHDGVIDEKDQCIDVPAGKAPDAAKAGCPADRDGDTVPDETDACPDKVGAPDPDPRKNGCPGKVKIEKGQIVILEQVYFATGKDEILKKSFGLLDAVVNAIKSLPAERKVDVEGHTDNKGDAAKNQELSQKRADSVKKYLVDKGIAAERLNAHGHGQDQPIADNKTDAGRAKNRRVEFHIQDAAAQ